MTISTKENRLRWMNPSRLLIAVLVVLILAAGSWVRVKELSADPLDVSHPQQLFFLLTAQSFRPASSQNAAALPSSSDFVSATRDLPLLQWIDAGLSGLFHADMIVVARLLSVIGWMLASLMLYLIVARVASPLAALTLLAMMVFMPFSIQFSRVVLPGAWAMFLAILFLWALWRWLLNPRWKTALLGGVFGALAVLLDVQMLYVLLGALAAVGLEQKKSPQPKSVFQPLMMLALLLLPRLGYTLAVHPSSQWISSWLGFEGIGLGLAALKQLVRLELRVESIIGVLGIGFALIGVLLTEKGPRRSLLIGLWGGFGVMCLVFLSAIADSIYVLYPVILLTGISFLALFEILLDQMTENRLSTAGLVLLMGVLVIAGGLGMIDGRRLVSANPGQIPVDFWRALGQKLGPDAIFLSNTNEVTLPLAYYGKVQPACISAGGNCTNSATPLASELQSQPLYFVAFKGDLAEGMPLAAQLQNDTLRCDAGSGVVLIPLTSIHPACDGSGG